MKKKLSVFLALLCILLAAAAGTALYAGANQVDLSFLSFEPDLYYGRAALADLEDGDDLVKVYDLIVKSVENGEAETIINTMHSVNDIVINYDQLNVVLSAYRYDNPQQFWMDKFSYKYFTISGEKIIHSILFGYHSHFNIATAKAEFEAAMDEFLVDAGVNASMSEYEISKRLHDAVAKQIVYTAGKPNSHNAYGALIEGEAVCEGYAELYQYALYRMGIQSHMITGDAGGPHGWNLVRIDGKYYQTDVTWDDQEEIIFYDYLNTTTARMLEERIIDNHGYALPVCTDTEANFFYRGEGALFSNTPDYKDAVRQLRENGIARFYYTGTQKYTLNSFYTWFITYRAMIETELNANGSYSFQLLNREYIVINTSYVPRVVKGDADGDGVLLADDAIYLLYFVLFGPEEYPVSGSNDFDGNGIVEADDAIYLLYNVLFGEAEYPLH